MKKIFFLFGLLSILFFIVKLPIVKAVAPYGNYIEANGGYIRAKSILSSSPLAFTFEAWVKPKDISGYRPVLSIGDKTGKKLHYEIGINGGYLQMQYNYSTSAYKSIITGSVPANVWSHIAFTIDSVSTKIFINGKVVNRPLGGASSLLPIGPDIVLGSSYEESLFSKYFLGDMDEVRISNISQDVVSLWNSGAYQSGLISDSSTIFLWNMSGSRGETVVLDSSQNKIDGTLIGGDSKIHYFGVVPTSTPYIKPTSKWTLPPLPTLSFPGRITPTIGSSVTPTIMVQPTPTGSSIHDLPRPTRVGR